MHIVHICTELAPVAKVGGLADVVYGLSRELIRQGHTVEVILPKYDTIDYSKIKNLHVCYRELWSYDGPATFNNTIWSAELDEIKMLLIEPHHPSYFFSRGTIYGASDDTERFLYFTRAAMEFLFKSGRQPDCIHLHDWPVATAATLYKDMYIPLGLKSGGTLLTIHNMEHQGKCSPHQLFKIGLQPDFYCTEDKYLDPIIPQIINLLKGGINDASFVTTVSPRYAKEIMTKEGGHGLEKVLLNHEDKITGILNGIDYSFWNPDTDPHLIENYPSGPFIEGKNLQRVIEAKKENKKQLQMHLNLEISDRPLIGCITRLALQKGPQLIIHAIRTAVEKGMQFVLLGSEYSHELHRSLLELKSELDSKRQFGLLLDRNESIAHLIFAGADCIIVPSLFEPCGLTQMIALRYGSIPIVRKTGGLADTVDDVEDSQKTFCERTGFVFTPPTFEAVSDVIGKVNALWEKDKSKWLELIRHGLAKDLSWKQSVHEYAKLYEILKRKKDSQT